MDHRTNLSFLLYTVAEICIFNGMAQSSAFEAHIITNTRRLAGGPTTSVVYSAYGTPWETRTPDTRGRNPLL